MSYLVVVTFDLSDPTPAQYETAKEILISLGLSKTLVGSTKEASELPSTTYAGEFAGDNAAKIRGDLSEQIKSRFTERNLHASIFISVGASWAWAKRTT